MRRWVAVGSVGLLGLLVPSPAAAQHAHEEPAAGHDAHAAGHDAHGAVEAAGAAHEAHGGHEVHINWAEGFVGESNEEPPGLLWRPVGTPPPVMSNIINAGLLFFILFKFGKAPLAEGLKKRKARIVSGMDEAGKMKREAESTLAAYEEKLRHIDDEIERVRREMREAAEAERRRILGEAKERRARMERDAQLLIEQELKAARDALMRETVRAAVTSAEDLLKGHVTPQDHERLAKEYADSIASSGVNASGGRA